MTAPAIRLRETLTGVHVERSDCAPAPLPGALGAWLRATVAVLGRQWTASVVVRGVEDNTAGGFGWWAWAEGCLLDKGGEPVVGVRVGPVGMPSRRSAIRDACTEALSQLQACAWEMVEDR